MDKKVSDLTEVINLVDDALFYVVDTADLSEDVAGTSKKIKKSSLIKKASILHSGTVKTDITEADPVVYTKTTMDSLLTAKADLVGGKVPASQLPSYVDDVVEVANFGALPITGESGKIYVTIDNNKQYRWTGTVYVEFTAGVSDHTLLTNIGTNTHDQIDTHIGNKQNSLIVDGTGAKYPTVDAVNGGLVLKSNDTDVIHTTGDESKDGSLYIQDINNTGNAIIGDNSNNTAGVGVLGSAYSALTVGQTPYGIGVLGNGSGTAVGIKGYSQNGIGGWFTGKVKIATFCELTGTGPFVETERAYILASGLLKSNSIIINQTTDNGVDKLQVNGSTLSTAFKKTGDTNANILLAGGGVTALSGLATTANLATKQDVLVSGTNIKTINGTTILGSGDIVTFSGSIVPLNEGNGIGYVIEGRNPANYGNIGLGAVDFSFSDSASSTKGATGLGSFATGLNNIAGGQYSSAFGNGNNVTNNFSVCFGDRNVIQSIGSFGSGIFNNIGLNADYSAVFGNGHIITSVYASAFGSGNLVSGANATAFGSRNFARAGGEVVIGNWCTDYTPDGFIDRSFNIGRGFSEATRNDIFTVFKNGSVRFFRETLANITNPLSGMLIFDSGNANRPTIHDGTAWRPLAYNDQFIDKEIPSGLINGSNVTFTLVNTPVVGSEHVYRNGILQESGAGNDYTISGATITYLTAPLTGDKLRVTYRR